MNLIYKLIHSPTIQCLCLYKSSQAAKKSLPDGESNPGLPRDRRGYLPLYYRGLTKAAVSKIDLNIQM